MRLKIVGIVAFLLLLLGAGWWFWSLSAISFEPRNERVVLTVQQAPVEIQPGGRGDWQAVSSSRQVFASDEIRTGKDGRVTIQFFDQAQVRLQGDSQMHLETIDLDDAPTIGLTLREGELWSRVLPIPQLNGRFFVQTPSFLASARGGSFDVFTSATGSVIHVIDAAVDVDHSSSTTSTQTAIISVPEGYSLPITTDGKIGSMRPSTGEGIMSAWFTLNQQADEAFKHDIQHRIEARLRDWTKAQPFSWKDAIVRLSERVRMSIAGDQKAQLYATYVSRRLFGAKTLIDAGTSGLALQAMASLESDIRVFLKQSLSASYRQELQKSLFEMEFLLIDVGPASPLYRFEQHVEDLAQLIASDVPASNLNIRLFAISGQLDLTNHLIASNSLEEAGISIEAARQGIVNVEGELESNLPLLSVDQAAALRSILISLKARGAAMQLGLASALVHAPFQSSTSTTPGTTSSTDPTVSSQLVSDIDTITLIASPNPILKGHLAELRVSAMHQDGTVTDVTTRVSFRVVGDAGTVSGPSFIGVKKGTATVEARLTDGKVSLSATTRVQVQEESRLARIDVMPENSPMIKQGQQTGIIVKAYYTDGRTAIVTSQTKWKTSDQNIGTAANGIFSAWIHGVGDVTITGSYTEDGVTKSSPLIFTVTPAE